MLDRVGRSPRDVGDVAARAGFCDWTEEVFGVDVADLRLTRRGLVER